MWMLASLATMAGGCERASGDDGGDLTLVPDGAPAELDAGDVPAGSLAALTDAGWVALCEALYAGAPLALDGQGNQACLDADCEASPTAVEDCAAATAPAPASCAPPEPLDPLRACAAPVDVGRACLAAVLGQFEAYAALTCASLGELAPVSFDLTGFAACQPLLEACPNLVAAS
jgi:hypothetical protein